MVQLKDPFVMKRFRRAWEEKERRRLRKNQQLGSLPKMLVSISYATGPNGDLVSITEDSDGVVCMPLPDASIAKAKALAAVGNCAGVRKVLAGCREVGGKLVCPLDVATAARPSCSTIRKSDTGVRGAVAAATGPNSLSDTKSNTKSNTKSTKGDVSSLVPVENVSVKGSGKVESVLVPLQVAGAKGQKVHTKLAKIGTSPPPGENKRWKPLPMDMPIFCALRCEFTCRLVSLKASSPWHNSANTPHTSSKEKLCESPNYCGGLQNWSY